MFGLCVGGAIVLLLVNICIRKELTNPSNYMLIFWTISILFNRYSFIEYYAIADKTYQVIFVGLCAFFCGDFAYYIFFIKQKKRVMSERFVGIHRNYSHNPNRTVLFGYILLHFASTVYFAFRMMKLHQSGYSFAQLRSIYQGYEEGVSFASNYFEELILNWIQDPLAQILPIIALVLLIQRQKEYRIFYILIFVDEIIYVLYKQSRATVFFLLIYMVLLFFIYKDEISTAMKRWMLLIGMMVLMSILILTVVRFAESKSWSGLRSYVLYAGGEISLLNYGIEKVDRIEFQSYGVNFFYGWYVLLSDIAYLFQVKMSSFATTLRDFEAAKESFIRIGPSVWFNAYYSFFYDFYAAFRMFGVAIGSFFFGMMSERRVYRMRSNRYNTKDVCYGLMTCIVLFMGLVRWQYVSPTFCFAYLYLFFLFHIKIELKFRARSVTNIVSSGAKDKK